MKRAQQDPVHVWLVMLKATQAIMKYAAADIQKTKLGDSEFRILEVLLHKGPLPVNTIGPIVNLTPGSISVAVDRLHRRGLVSRIEGDDDRRIRIVELTRTGRSLIVPAFRKHAAGMKRLFAELTQEELRQFEIALKKVGRCADTLSRRDSRL
jgi:MarR family transcriptional regulator, 2-MHQ and catechol-resistance regulon repressor